MGGWEGGTWVIVDIQKFPLSWSEFQLWLRERHSREEHAVIEPTRSQNHQHTHLWVGEGVRG